MTGLLTERVASLSTAKTNRERPSAFHSGFVSAWPRRAALPRGFLWGTRLACSHLCASRSEFDAFDALDAGLAQVHESLAKFATAITIAWLS